MRCLVYRSLTLPPVVALVGKTITCSKELSFKRWLITKEPPQEQKQTEFTPFYQQYLQFMNSLKQTHLSLQSSSPELSGNYNTAGKHPTILPSLQEALNHPLILSVIGSASIASFVRGLLESPFSETYEILNKYLGLESSKTQRNASLALRYGPEVNETGTKREAVTDSIIQLPSQWLHRNQIEVLLWQEISQHMEQVIKISDYVVIVVDELRQVLVVRDALEAIRQQQQLNSKLRFLPSEKICLVVNVDKTQHALLADQNNLEWIETQVHEVVDKTNAVFLVDCNMALEANAVLRQTAQNASIYQQQFNQSQLPNVKAHLQQNLIKQSEHFKQVQWALGIQIQLSQTSSLFKSNISQLERQIQKHNSLINQASHLLKNQIHPIVYQHVRKGCYNDQQIIKDFIFDRFLSNHYHLIFLFGKFLGLSEKLFSLINNQYLLNTRLRLAYVEGITYQLIQQYEGLETQSDAKSSGVWAMLSSNPKYDIYDQSIRHQNLKQAPYYSTLDNYTETKVIYEHVEQLQHKANNQMLTYAGLQGVAISSYFGLSYIGFPSITTTIASLILSAIGMTYHTIKWRRLGKKFQSQVEEHTDDLIRKIEQQYINNTQRYFINPKQSKHKKSLELTEQNMNEIKNHLLTCNRLKLELVNNIKNISR